MEKNKKIYQLVCLFTPSITKEELLQNTASIKQFVTSQEGSIDSKDPFENEVELVTQALGYPIRKQERAFIWTINISLPIDSISEFNEFLQSNNNILRHMLSNHKISKAQPAKRREERKVDFNMVDKIEPLIEKKEEIKDKPVIEEKEEPKQEKVEVEIDELDKKLQEILNQ